MAGNPNPEQVGEVNPSATIPETSSSASAYTRPAVDLRPSHDYDFKIDLMGRRIAEKSTMEDAAGQYLEYRYDHAEFGNSINDDVVFKGKYVYIK